jgi:hypothetical protein
MNNVTKATIIAVLATGVGAAAYIKSKATVAYSFHFYTQVGSSQSPVEGVSISMNDSTGKTIFTGVSDSNGNVVGNLPPQTYSFAWNYSVYSGTGSLSPSNPKASIAIVVVH